MSGGGARSRSGGNSGEHVGAPVAATAPEATARTSVATTSALGFGGGVVSAAFGLLVGIMTARYLGTAAKGTLSSLSYAVALVAPVCALGLGEASQVLVGQRRFSEQQAVKAVAGALVLSTAVGAAAFVLVVSALSPGQVPGVRLAVIAAATTLPVIVAVDVLARLLDTLHQGAFVSGVRIVIAAVTAAATLLFMDGLDRATTGALLAVAIGWGAGACLMCVRLVRLGAAPVPSLNRSFLRAALPLGLPTVVSAVAVVASTRLDLLFMHALAGPAQAGQYSVALTIGALATYAPTVLMNTAFPRLAEADLAGARAMAARVSRAGVATTVLSGAAVACVAPFLVPAAFGPDFAGSVGPALVLLVSAVPWGAQLTACRLEAARGRTHVLLVSFSSSLLVMVALDLLLIPRHGSYGAAAAAGASAVVGFAIALLLRGPESITPGPSGFLPHRRDLGPGLRAIGRILRQGRGADQTQA